MQRRAADTFGPEGRASSVAVDAATDLVIRCQRGERSACDALLHSVKRQIYALVRAAGRDAEWTEDTVVEAMVQVYRSIGSFRFRSSFSTWAFSVAAKVCAAELRKAGRLKWSVTVPVVEAVTRDDPADEVAAKVQQEGALEAVASLPEKYRTAVALRYLGDCSYRELADIMKVPIGTAKTLVFQGVKRIRKALPATGGEEVR